MSGQSQEPTHSPTSTPGSPTQFPTNSPTFAPTEQGIVWNTTDTIITAVVISVFVVGVALFIWSYHVALAAKNAGYAPVPTTDAGPPPHGSPDPPLKSDKESVKPPPGR